LSPDGRRIAAKASIEGKSVIAVFDLPSDPARKPLLLGVGDAQFRWAGNERLLLIRGGAFAASGITFHAFQILSHEIATAKTVELGFAFNPIGDGLLFVDPAGRYILRAQQSDLSKPPSVVRIDLADASQVEVQPAVKNVWTWFVDASGLVRAGAEYGERKTIIHYRRTQAEPLKRIVARNYAGDDSVLDAIRFLDDADTGFIVTNSRTGRFGVYRYDFLHDKFGETVWEHPEVDAQSVISGPNGEIDGVTYVDDRLRVHWIDKQAAQIQRLVDKTLPGKINLLAGSSSDGNSTLVWSGAADDPGTYYVFDRARRRMEVFASPFEKLAGTALAPMKAVRYAARDGLSIPAYLTLPPGRSPRGLPLVVMPHGGPFSRDTLTFDPMVQLLANRGYAVLQPNFRGSTGYGREFVERGYGALGTGMIDDIDAGVDWLAAEGIVDAKRVCIQGASYGGYAAVWAAMRSPARYRCAISMAGVSDIRAMLKYDVKYLVAGRYGREWKKRIAGAEKQDLAAVSPLQQASRLEVPVLIAHGELDANVPVKHSKDLVAALRKHGKQVESVFYPKSGHGFDTVEDSRDYMSRVEAFLAKHNPAE
jgi:dipeptidyl aminopeptidase/acylaminoacyl peptidase